ncbi:MAG: L,D-transpeptidase family protein [Cyclonatronaceae bacterium]
MNIRIAFFQTVRLLLLTCLILSFSYSSNTFATGTDEWRQEQVRELLRNRIETGRLQASLKVSDEPIFSQQTLPAFYVNRGFETAWTTNGKPFAAVDSLITAIKRSYNEGLVPDDYHLGIIEEYVTDARNRSVAGLNFQPGLIVDIELLCTDAYLILASHYLAGKVDPATFDSFWRANRRELDLATYLQSSLNNSEIITSLNSLLPDQPGYRHLRDALARYRQIERDGGWPVIPDGPVMRRGDQGDRIPLLRQKLILAGDLPGPADSLNTLFDDILESAVRQFQYRHGLDADGIVGAATTRALNTPVRNRIISAEINLERWRWLPQDLGDRYIVVNIAGFDVRVIEFNEIVLQMKAVVGRLYRQTPVFSGNMTYLVLSPFWNVPPTIAGQDVLPQVQRDVEYLARQNMKVFQGWGAESREVDPATVDWSTVNRRTMPYRFRQDPGPINALGTVKFMFPNQFHVYLHDSPARELFGRAQRDFSSGCIRVEKPLELASYLLKGTRWTTDEIRKAMNEPAERTVTLPRSIPVHLLYWTAWAEQDGTIHFRNDVYQRDGKLLDALRSIRPGIITAVKSSEM